MPGDETAAGSRHKKTMPTLLSGNPWCVRSKTQKRFMALQLESCSSDIPGSAPSNPFTPLLTPSTALTRVLSSTHLTPQPATRAPSVSFACVVASDVIARESIQSIQTKTDGLSPPSPGPSAAQLQTDVTVHPVPAESYNLVGRTLDSNDLISDKLKIFCSVDRGQATRIALREACTRLRETHCEWADCSAVLNSSQTLAIHLNAVHFEEEGKPSPLTVGTIKNYASVNAQRPSCGRVYGLSARKALRQGSAAVDTLWKDMYLAHYVASIKDPSTLVAHTTRHIKDKNTLRPSIYPSFPLDLALPANIIKPRESYCPVVTVNPSFSPTAICMSRHTFPEASRLENWRFGPYQRSRPAPAKLAKQMSDLKDDTDLTNVVLWPRGGMGAQQSMKYPKRQTVFCVSISRPREPEQVDERSEFLWVAD
ncbi:hypothetical protein DFH06DRAFT_1309324 [Mycena polygramma]|nr:hypothetical protein DFH06DRAFT_1309324 [Mycena polygramma]